MNVSLHKHQEKGNDNAYKHEPVSTNSHESFNSFSHLLFSLGVKFIVLADKWQQKVPDLLKRIYELYTDYVLKNPFYSLDMPIK